MAAHDVTRNDIEQEVQLLRDNLDRYPSLKPLVENYDPDTLQLEAGAIFSGPLVELITRKDKNEQYAERIEIFNDRAEELAFQLKDGQITLLDFMFSMQAAIKGAHVSAYTIGKGGEWSEMTPQDWGSVGAALRRQYDFLSRWVQEMTGNLDDFSEARIAQRAKMYGASSRQSLERGIASARAGFDIMRLLPAMPGDGTTLCLSNCKCHWSIRVISKKRGDYDVGWRLGRAEHCATCRQRAISWKRIRIRDFEVVSEIPEVFASP